MTDTNTDENKDALMEALAAKLLAPSAPSINPKEWTDEQRNTFVEALIDDIGEQISGFVDYAIESAIESADLPDADDIRCDVKQDIMDDLDYSVIAGNIDADDIDIDYDSIASEVVGWIDSQELAQHVDASEINLSDMPIEREIKRLVMEGCDDMNDAAVVLIGRAMNSSEYGESGIRILTKDEYESVIAVSDCLNSNSEASNSRLERVLNFVETTFNIPEPESEDTGETADDIIKNIVKSGTVKTCQLINSITQGNIELARELRSMKKGELVEYMDKAGWHGADGTKAELIEKVESWIGGA